MQVQLENIKLGSAFKVGAVLSGVMFIIIFVPLIFFQGLILSAAMVASSQNFDPAMLGGLGIAGICIALVVGTITYALMGGVGALLSALAYNIISGWVGGLEFDLKKVSSNISEKRKNDF